LKLFRTLGSLATVPTGEKVRVYTKLDHASKIREADLEGTLDSWVEGTLNEAHSVFEVYVAVRSRPYNYCHFVKESELPAVFEGTGCNTVNSFNLFADNDLCISHE
jgi:hypothetical protein